MSEPLHYKNGRPAKWSDIVVRLDEDRVAAIGYLHSIMPSESVNNGQIAQIEVLDLNVTVANCLHIDDVKVAKVPDNSKPL